MNKNIVIGVLAVLALLGTGYLYLSSYTSMLGASGYTNFQKVSFLQGLDAGPRSQFNVTNQGVVTIGPSGSSITELKATTCDMLNANTSINASTTGYVYCTGITGLASGDVVMAQLSTTSMGTLFTSGWVIISAKASSTAGAIDFRLANYSGTARAPAAVNVGSSTNVWYMDN